VESEKFLFETLGNRAYDLSIVKETLPAYISDNLRFSMFAWQKSAIENLITANKIKAIEAPGVASHFMFNMATGTGKTLVLAAAILYYYKLGYRNFIFFVDQNNIVGKTEDNILDPDHTKYLFSNPIVIDEKTVEIKKVNSFSPLSKTSSLERPSIDHIEIIFTSIHKLHNSMYLVRENEVFLDDLQNRDLILLADEAHSFSADTKKSGKTLDIVEFKELKGSSAKVDVERSWENTVTKKLLQKEGAKVSSNNNVLLEFTATIPNDTMVLQKYRDKILSKFDLPEFLKAGYTKEINLVSSNFDRKQRIIQALLFNWFRHQIALDNGIPNFKAVILFRSKFASPDKEGNVEDDYRFFRDIVDGLKESDFQFLDSMDLSQLSQSVYETGQSRIVDIVQLIQDRFSGSYQSVISYIKSMFKEINCIITHSHEKGATGRTGEEKTTYEQDKLLNSLEDKNNPITAVFTCKRLTQGWDVLNLYDIVRMYEGQNTGGSNKKGAGGSTTSEVQLIGRGVRYNPFSYADKERNKRKFDKQLDHPLRVLEEFYFHSDKDERYITELKRELKNQKLFDDSNRTVVYYGIKDSIKKNKKSFYHKHKIFGNEQLDNPNRKRSDLADIHATFKFTYSIPESQYSAERLNLDIGMADTARHFQRTGDSVTITKSISAFIDGGFRHIILKAFNEISRKEKSIFRFQNLKNELRIGSSDELWKIDFLGKLELTLVLPSAYTTLEEISPRTLVEIFVRFFDELEACWKTIIHPKIGSAFAPRSFASYFDRPKPIHVNQDSHDESFESLIVQKEWYALDHFHGTSEERSLVQFVMDSVGSFKKKFSNLHLIRNEEVYKIYDFESGRGFMPDFILVMSSKTENLQYQVFIEPKGTQFMNSTGTFVESKEGWKEQFLLEITRRYGEDAVLKSENDEYKLIGLPFYNQALPQVIKQSIKENLDIDL